MNKTFKVKWQSIYSQEVLVKANDEESAIEIARTTSHKKLDKTFIENDYYEAEEVDEDEDK